MSLFRPDGTYYGPVPPWFTPKADDAHFTQVVVRVDRQFAEWLGVPHHDIQAETITLMTGRYGNGAPKWRFASQLDLDIFEKRKALEERW